MFIISYTVSYESRHMFVFNKKNSVAPSTKTSVHKKKFQPVVIK